jgi:hypothetical protein
MVREQPQAPQSKVAQDLAADAELAVGHRMGAAADPVDAGEIGGIDVVGAAAADLLQAGPQIVAHRLGTQVDECPPPFLLQGPHRGAERIGARRPGVARDPEDVAEKVATVHADEHGIGILRHAAIVTRPALLTEAADRFGAQCVVASIDAKRDAQGVYKVWVKGGREETPLEAVAWAQECVARGAGEILLTSIDRDGARTGYDLTITRAVADAVQVPVIASGGAGVAQHLVDGIVQGGADAVLVAGILHDGVTTVQGLKQVMREAGLPVRNTSTSVAA